MPTSHQEYVARVYDPKPPIFKPQPQRAGFVEAFEYALGRRSCSARCRADGRRRARRCGSARSPRPASGRARPGSRRRGARGRRPGGTGRIEAGCPAAEIFGMVGEIDAEAEDHRVALPLEQNAGELGAVDEQVVGPFDPRLGRIGPRPPRAKRPRRPAPASARADRRRWSRTRVEAYRLPGGDCHALPCRPLPPVCRSARSQRPSGAPSRASAATSSLVEPVSGTVRIIGWQSPLTLILSRD